MALDSTALITVAEAKTYIWGSAGGAPSTLYDSLLEGIINGISLGVERFLENAVVIRTFTEDYSGGPKAFIRGGSKRIKTEKYPITGVTSITDDDANTVEAEDYTIIADLGWLEHDGHWPVPTGRWTIIYTAGLYADTASVDAMIKLAAQRITAGVFKRRVPGVKSEKIDQVTITYDISEIRAGVIPDEIADLLPAPTMWV